MLTPRVVGVDLIRLGDEIVSCVALCGHDDNYVIALGIGLGDNAGDPGDRGRILDGCSSEFLNYECHCFLLSI